jgi:hypothetical protein
MPGRNSIVLTMLPASFELNAEWEAATPESQQVDVAVLDAFHRDLASGDLGNIDDIPALDSVMALECVLRSVR